MGKVNYDCAAIFTEPLYLEGKHVYGILFNKQYLIKVSQQPWNKVRNYTYQKIVDEYMVFLTAYDRFMKNGHFILTDSFWMNKWCDDIYPDKNALRLVGSLLDINYEVAQDIEIEIKDGETNVDWIISPELVERIKNLP